MTAPTDAIASPTVALTVDADGIAQLRMQDAAGKNAFSRAFVSELRSALSACARPGIKVVVLRGLSEVFCAGGDLALLRELATGDIEPYDLELTRALLDVPVPTIAAAAGHAVGGGLVFALGCDIVALGRESRYGANFMDLGFTPGMGATALLTRAFGEYLAAEMMFGTRYFKGAELERAGLNRVLPRAEVDEWALQLAARIADKTERTLRLLKRTLATARRQAFESARVTESLMHEIAFATPDTRARIEAAYLTNPPPEAAAPAGSPASARTSHATAAAPAAATAEVAAVATGSSPSDKDP